MKFLKVLMSLALVAISALVATETGNVLAGVATIPVLTYGFQAVTGYSLFSADGMALGALTSIKRGGDGVPNPGGGRKLFLAPIDAINGEWPKRSDIVGGEITMAPPLTAAAPAAVPPVLAGAFVEIAVSDNSLKLDGSLKGAVGYQSWDQGIEVKIAGYTKEQCAAIDKLLNQEVVCVVLANDGGRIVVGTSFNGQQFEIMHTTGAKGGDRREWTLKSKQDGYMFCYQPLAASVVIPGITV